MKSELVRVLIGIGAMSLSACTTTVNNGTGGEGGGSVGLSNVTVAANATTNGTASTGKGTTGSGSQSTPASTSSGSSDPYAAARATCVAKINSLRATLSIPALTEWTSAETCVDKDATSDEMAMSAHQAWIAGTNPTCMGNGQDECLGQGVNGISSCLDQMWAEKDLPGCSGCIDCINSYNPNCPNCDFDGSLTGQECGHFVNMSAKYFSKVACGFSSLGGWDAQDFE